MLAENTMPEDPKKAQEKNVSSVAIEEWLIINLAEACEVPREEIDVQLPITSLGLASLTLFELTSDLADWLGRDIPTTMLWGYPTIAGIAGHLGQESQDEDSLGAGSMSFMNTNTCLVTLQPDGDLPPLFLAHDVSGTVWCYAALLRHLGKERPVYGFQIPLREDETFIVPTLEELAATYVAELRHKQPSGPYYLGGFSMGGVMAFEMAHQLRQSGEEVALLALMDSRFPGMKSRKPSFWRLVRIHARNVRPLNFVDKVRYIFEHRPSPTGRMLRVHVRNLRSLTAIGKVRYVVDRLSRRPQLSEPQETEIEQQRFRDALLKSKMSDQLGQMQEAYTPKRYEGVITLLSARWKFSIRDDFRAWRRIAVGGIKQHFTLGSHNTIVMEPHVRNVAALLEKCLSEAHAHITR